ncbi:LysR family transcriptional regulator [Halomonas sp. KAO]|uniref:LysR family transcriptional regulator n=1 Tax=unclassified Halomonas TaxID=2609666 RepID=UPI00189E8AAD|nr:MULTISPECIES: LysR family transcriptional regulator [unclassified Halomonas]MBF7052457.1 LysR family transcriptional regulator [Halomonas sp. KAO]MDT0499811.1 LysR family transcriptional regulator [Halomonas sp. PAR7]MDT0510372.1 LysR family transcriptional regulator [Halomonas sp. LES1]MDT0589919.1 LysR family transcriptional regulator [Halomonas sp. PAR8]
MELRWLEDFMALARTRHFSRAAEQQNVTQPTFSRRIKLLEEEMGTVLVNRQTLPLSLTPAGEEFLALCHDVTQRVAESRRRLAHLADQHAGRIRLAAPQSLLSHFLPAWLGQWPAPPPITPDLRATGWLVDDFFRALARDECDLVLCFWPCSPCGIEPDTQDYLSWRLAGERMVPLSLPEPGGEPRFSLEGASSLPLIAYHPRGLTDAAIRAHLARFDDTPDFRILNESIQSSNIRELVSLGYGLGWLPESSVRDELAQGALVPAGGERWQVPMDIVLFRRADNQQPAVTALWDELVSDRPID